MSFYGALFIVFLNLSGKRKRFFIANKTDDPMKLHKYLLKFLIIDL